MYLLTYTTSSILHMIGFLAQLHGVAMTEAIFNDRTEDLRMSDYEDLRMIVISYLIDLLTSP